ncbi:hypothetical protein ACX40Y_09005 [Sphingomonas sp. RS6]
MAVPRQSARLVIDVTRHPRNSTAGTARCFAPETIIELKREHRMKKLRMMAVAGVLVAVAGCDGGEQSNVSDISNESLEANAMIYQEASDNAANAAAEAMIANAGVAENATGDAPADQN